MATVALTPSNATYTLGGVWENPPSAVVVSGGTWYPSESIISTTPRTQGTSKNAETLGDSEVATGFSVSPSGVSNNMALHIKWHLRRTDFPPNAVIDSVQPTFIHTTVAPATMRHVERSNFTDAGVTSGDTAFAFAGSYGNLSTTNLAVDTGFAPKLLPSDEYTYTVALQRIVEANMWTIVDARLSVTYFIRSEVTSVDLDETHIVAESATPEVRWSRTWDADGGGLTHYEAQILDLDGNILRDSGEQAGALTTWTPSSPLLEGTYTSRVRVAQTVRGSKVWSGYATKQFTIDASNAPTPSSGMVRPGKTTWTFVYTDQTYTPIGEITNAYDLKVSRPISKLNTASFRLRLDHPMAAGMAACDGYVKAYRNGRLEFFGPVISAEYTVAETGEPSVAINCVSSGWVLGKRLAGKSATGHKFETVTDRAQIVRALIATANSEDVPDVPNGGETGIAIDGIAAAGSGITFVAGPYRPIMEIISELSSADQGFEWQIMPRENSVDGEVVSDKIGTFVAAPKGIHEYNEGFGFGARREECVFEWGLGRSNVKGFRRSVTRDTQVNRGVHYVEGQTPLTVETTDNESVSRYKLLEELIQVDLTTENYRRQFVNESVRVRANPRQIIEFTPGLDNGLTGRVPRYGIDYEVGDVVRARAKYGGTMLFDAWFRIWGMSFEIDTNGRETGAFALVEESA